MSPLQISEDSACDDSVADAQESVESVVLSREPVDDSVVDAQESVESVVLSRELTAIY